MQSMYLKVGLIKETKGGGKEGKKWGWHTSHLCRNKTQANTLQTVKQHRIGGNERSACVQHMYRYNTKAKMSLNNEQTPKQQRTRMKNGSH
jgi:hypothetical protein